MSLTSDLTLIMTGYPDGEIVVRKSEENFPMVCAYFRDAECDPFFVEYPSEDTLIIHCGEWEYLMLDASLLMRIANLTAPAAEKWDELEQFAIDDESGEFEGWEHLITERRPMQ